MYFLVFWLLSLVSRLPWWLDARSDCAGGVVLTVLVVVCTLLFLRALAHSVNRNVTAPLIAAYFSLLFHLRLPPFASFLVVRMSFQGGHRSQSSLAFPRFLTPGDPRDKRL